MNDSKYEFTVGLAAFDFLPCIFFAVGGLTLASAFDDAFFTAGIVLSAFAGFSKAIWKLLLTWAKKDLPVCQKLFHICMPTGFGFMLVALILNVNRIDWVTVGNRLLGFPQVLFFLLCLAGMIVMSIFANKLDQTKASSNWTEEITNCFAQFCFMMAIILSV